MTRILPHGIRTPAPGAGSVTCIPSAVCDARECPSHASNDDVANALRAGVQGRWQVTGDREKRVGLPAPDLGGSQTAALGVFSSPIPNKSSL